MNKPAKGDIVSVPVPFSNDRKEGEVTALLAVQFMIVDSNGNILFCLYKNDWQSLT